MSINNRDLPTHIFAKICLLLDISANEIAEKLAKRKYCVTMYTFRFQIEAMFYARPPLLSYWAVISMEAETMERLRSGFTREGSRAKNWSANAQSHCRSFRKRASIANRKSSGNTCCR